MSDLFSCQAKSLPISVTSTASASTALPSKGNSIRIVNEGPFVAFISVGSGAQVATLPNATPTVTSVPVMPGDTSLSIDPTAIQNISAVCRASQTATLTVQVSEGM